MIQLHQDQCARLKNQLRCFHFLAEEDLPRIGEYFTCASVRAGETLWSEGDPGEFEAFIIEGKVEVSKETEFPGHKVVVGVYSPGAVIGELCMIEQQPRGVTAVALEDTSLLLLSRERFELLLEHNPSLGIKLIKGMLLAVSIRLRKSFERLAAIF
jgi:CRP/FNR family transcriptional regulator, cyclic AMP receptor protein